MKAKRLIALALAAVFMLSAAATPVFAAAALPQENAALEQQNDMVSIRLKATGDLVYGSNYKLEVQTNPADTQYIGVVVGVGGEANGYVTLVLSDKIRTLLKMGKQKGAIAVYEEMSELFFSNFGVMPSDELRALYRKATRTVNNHALSVEDLRDQLKEERVVGGAMLCTYDFFKILYRSETRTMARTGNTAHLCLLSVAAKDGSELPKRSLDRAMENLQELIRQNLRKGDVASQCSVSQYVILLPRANYENSHMVANRLMTAFYRRYPHSPARLRCVVQPLEPLA